ncbi:MAG: hypothetical protein IJO91_07450 [Oscillospiraceae bacterium]|nr:hypothetical protein [Oscillospiraceae bacterium]
MNNTSKTELFRKAIREQADEEIRTVTTELRERRAAAGKTRAELEAKDALEAIRTDTNRITAQFRREISKCDYEMKKSILNHRNDLINEFFTETETRLKKFVESEEYSAYLKRSLEKIRTSIALDSATLIYARPQDIDAVRTLTSCEVAVDNTIRLGGLRAICRAKNVLCDVTLDVALDDEKRLFTEKTELRL